MNPQKKEFNEKMDRYINAVESLTQDQIDACAFVMGDYTGFTKETIISELFSEKYDDEPEQTEPEPINGSNHKAFVEKAKHYIEGLTL